MTRQRLLTAAVLIPIVIAADLFLATRIIAILVALITALALREFFALAAQAGFPGHPRWTIFCSLLLVAAQYFDIVRAPHFMYSGAYFETLGSPTAIFPGLVFLIFILGTILLTLSGPASTNTGLPAVAVGSAAILFVAFPLSFLVRIHATTDGRPLLLFLLVLIWTGDSLAYLVGRKFGRHPMASLTSPQKTWEGAAANLAGSVLVALIAIFWLRASAFTPTAIHLLAIAVLANVAGQIGDLAESIYKRSAGAKDSGTLLPGHGGVLDRIDSLIFAAPVVWYYVTVAFPLFQ